jgi:molybdopterin-containing oxidoreductase family membrane subunit
MAKLRFQRLERSDPASWAVIALQALLLALGLAAALYMEEHGHAVSGMSNQVVWGLPHVFAVFLIVAASGALNVASISSVFNRPAYKPYARLSGLLAIALLLGGLAVLVLDLGRPERLLVAMTTYNFKSIFAWNIYLYSGFVLIVGAYLFSMMDRRASQSMWLGKTMGWIAFGWRLVLTTGTGSIFGFLAAREAYDAAIMAPLFIAASFLYGLAFMVLVLAAAGRDAGHELLTAETSQNFRFLLSIFALSLLYFTVVHHLTKLYASGHQDVEVFLLRDGGIYPLLFWLAQIGCGTLLPLGLLASARDPASARRALPRASVLFLIGGLAQMYVVIVGGQAYPLRLFPGFEASSAFFDGAVASYQPSLPEWLLGVGGIALALLLVSLALRLMPFLPEAQTAKR